MKSKRMGRSNFKLIAQYDARRNEYSVWKHNLTEAQALEAVAEHSARAFAIFIIDQKQKHKAKEVDVCKACRADVEREAQLQPQPKFKKTTKTRKKKR